MVDLSDSTPVDLNIMAPRTCIELDDESAIQSSQVPGKVSAKGKRKTATNNVPLPQANFNDTQSEVKPSAAVGKKRALKSVKVKKNKEACAYFVRQAF